MKKINGQIFVDSKCEMCVWNYDDLCMILDEYINQKSIPCTKFLRDDVNFTEKGMRIPLSVGEHY